MLHIGAVDVRQIVALVPTNVAICYMWGTNVLACWYTHACLRSVTQALQEKEGVKRKKY